MIRVSSKLEIRLERGKLTVGVLTIDQLGRVQIPDAARKALGMLDCGQIRLEVQADRLVLIPLLATDAVGAASHDRDKVEESLDSELGLRRKEGILIIEAESIEGGNLDILADIREERIQGLMGL